VPTVPAPVVAQCWRGTPRQAQLARLLAGCEVEVLDDSRAKATGTLSGRARTTDIVDASVVEGALRRGDFIVSSDEGDLAAIAAAVSRQPSAVTLTLTTRNAARPDVAANILSHRCSQVDQRGATV
jgi:hypothetical protein